MNDMKCPVCQNNLHKINIIVSTCTNDKCKLWGSPIPNLVLKALAQTEQNLERTRKALDIAVDALKYANKCIKGGCVNWETEIDKALEQITALEQKDK